MNKRVVILWLCFFVWTVSLMAQDVPAGVVAAFKKGNSQELNGYLSDKVELILESRSINVDNQAAEKKMASFFSALIQQHYHIARLECFQYQFALFFFLYVCGEAFGIFQFRDNFHIEREIASRALYVVIDGCNKVLFYGSSYDEQGHFHMNY